MPRKQFLKKFWRRINKYIFLLVTTIVFFSVLVLINQVFLIRKIEIFGLPKNKTLLGLNRYRERNLLFLSAKEEEDRIREINPQIKSAVVEKIFPNVLRIRVVLYEPFVALRVKEGFFILSEDGRILFKEKEKKDSLPVINYYQLLNYQFFQPGDRVDYTDLAAALHFLNSVLDLGLEVTTVDISGFDMIGFKLRNKADKKGVKRIIFSARKKREKQDYELETIVKQFMIEGRDFRVIDLRFDKPIIKFK